MLASVTFLFGSGTPFMRRNVLAGGRRKAEKIGKDKFSAGQTFFCWKFLDPAITSTQRYVCYQSYQSMIERDSQFRISSFLIPVVGYKKCWEFISRSVWYFTVTPLKLSCTNEKFSLSCSKLRYEGQWSRSSLALSHASLGFSCWVSTSNILCQLHCKFTDERKNVVEQYQNNSWKIRTFPCKMFSIQLSAIFY